MRRIAIIGGGLSGALLALQLLPHKGVRVYLIDRSRRFGRGLAYGTEDQAHLLNVRAERLSLFPDHPDDFVNYLGGAHGAFAARTRYGAYIEKRLQRAARIAGGRLKFVREAAAACDIGEGEASVELASGKRIKADAVVLATGNPPAGTPAPFEGLPLIGAWDARALRRISPRDDVLLVGAGLTMIDVALSLSATRRSGAIYALSRRGLLPRPHSEPHPVRAEPADLPNALSEALAVLRERARDAEARGETWRSAIDTLRHHTPALWRRLTLEQQQRFLRHARPWWDVHRHRAAPEVATRIAELQGDGRLRVIAGKVLRAQKARRGFEVAYQARGDGEQRLEVKHIVNCTGASLDLTRLDDPLWRQLFASGFVRAHPNGLGLDADGEGRLLDITGAPQQRLFAIGPILQGALWECVAVPEIRARASALAVALGA